VARKERWEKMYAAPFSTVVFDDRKGKKHSGHRLHWKAGVGSVSLPQMEKVDDFDHLLTRALG
jgi:hypothetical protein